jgi:ribosomal protein L32
VHKRPKIDYAKACARIEVRRTPGVTQYELQHRAGVCYRSMQRAVDELLIEGDIKLAPSRDRRTHAFETTGAVLYVCPHCGEGAHSESACPRCQSPLETADELLRVRKLLRELCKYFGDDCVHPLAGEVRQRLTWPVVKS